MDAGAVTFCPAGFGHSNDNNNFTWWKGRIGYTERETGFVTEKEGN
jgi:hypothetical protein